MTWVPTCTLKVPSTRTRSSTGGSRSLTADFVLVRQDTGLVILTRSLRRPLTRRRSPHGRPPANVAVWLGAALFRVKHPMRVGRTPENCRNSMSAHLPNIVTGLRAAQPAPFLVPMSTTRPRPQWPPSTSISALVELGASRRSRKAHRLTPTQILDADGA